MGMQFTPDQQRVIDTRNSNILVSAAAGSGKTAVLVERIIQMITDDRNPVDIDRLLIVTFTSAAAAQMRERISRAVAQKLEENPFNEHLQKQTSLIHNAQITTIDSFCLFVIRNNFNEIGLDPGFRVADESEIKMLETDVMGKLLEEAHTEPTERFLRFVECYSTGSNEKKIEEAILRLYHFSMSYPFPEEWLTQRMEDYRLADAGALSGKKWFQGAIGYLNTVLQECEGRIRQALELASSTEGPVQYVENLESDLALLKQFQSASDYDTLYSLFTYASFTRLSAKKAEGVDPVLKDMVKAIREEVKKTIADLKKFLFQISLEDTIRDMAQCQEEVEELVTLTLSFKERLDQAKRDKNIIDFSDMEHFALQILLQKNEDGSIVPRSTALELQDYFEEIMIDEYQDSNEVQELLLKSISGEEKGRFNRFMVGDVKQSIYKFRLARPEIFMEKYDTYVSDGFNIEKDNAADNGRCHKIRIDLSMNFRSRREVTDAANFLCSQIMASKVGNVEYDERAALHAGASYPEPPEPEKGLPHAADIYQTELLIATPDSLAGSSVDSADGNAQKYSEKEIEAVMVADRIRRMVGKFPVTDAATGEVRMAKYADIVLLFRATAGWDEDFRRILSERGIPVHVTGRTGYFETLEIQGIVNFLKVLDNPLQDIPLFGVLKLPYFGFSETEITQIRCLARDYTRKEAEEGKQCKKKMYLYEQIQLIHTVFRDLEAIDKIELFLSTIADFRRRVAYTPIRELLQQLFATTGYEAYVGSMPGGDQRRANLELLLEKAGAFQKTSFYGLFHFIRYLETIQEQEVDFGEANILDENADVVRIMTIHKSKGLEFPICFVCGLSKQFNQMDMRQSIIMDVELGVGVDYVDPGMRLKRKTMRKNVVAQRMKEDTRGEDLRVLYVALTRAKEKLILTGFIKDLDKKIASNIFLTMEQGQKLPYSVIMNAVSYMDLMFAALMRHSCMENALEERGFEVVKHPLPYKEVPFGFIIYEEEKSLSKKMENQLKEQGKMWILEEELLHTGKLADAQMADKMHKRLHYAYPHMDLEGLTVKTTVSEVKRASYEEMAEESEELVPMPKEHYIPSFVTDTMPTEGEEQTVRAQLGTQYGTTVHKIMELLSFSEKLSIQDLHDEKERKHLYAVLCSEREQWIAEGRVTKEELLCVGTSKIIGFFQSKLSQRMIAANEKKELFKEQPFVLGIPANKLKERFPAEETVLIQGVIDVFFYEGDALVLADYKTDVVKCAQDLIDRYQTQMDYYQLALEQITGRRVKERYLYSFYLQEEILV